MAELGPVAALVYQALWITADDGGMAPCDPDRLKGEMFYGWRAIGLLEITEALRRLFAQHRIRFYQGSDELFGDILNWNRHQKVHKPSDFRYRQQYSDFSEVVPEWCRTSEELVAESPPPRLLETKTPGLSENQLHGSAMRRAEGSSPVALGSGRARIPDVEPSVGDLVALVATLLYIPDGKPPDAWDPARDGSIIKQLLKRHTRFDIASAIEGLALLRDYPGVYGDQVDWLQKGRKATLRALYNTGSGALTMFERAMQAYWKWANTRGSDQEEVAS